MSLNPKIEKMLQKHDTKGIIKALGSKSTFEDAADALVKIGEEAVKPLIKKFSGFSAKMPSVYAVTLARIGEPAVLPLIEVLNKKRSQIRDERRQACIALGEIGDERAIGPLCWARRKEPTMTGAGEFIIPAILKIAKPPYRALLQALESSNKDLKLGALDTLWEISREEKLDENAIEPLSNALQDPETKVRQIASFCLGGIYDERVIEPLRRALNDNSMFVRDGARGSLKRVFKKFLTSRPDETLAFCEKWINDEHKWIRRFGVKSFNSIISSFPKENQLGEREINIIKKVMDAIERVMDDNDKGVKKEVSGLLKEISKKDQELVYNFLLKRADTENEDTKWIIEHGMKKLSKNLQKAIRALYL